MPDFKEILTANPDAFQGIDGVDTTIETITGKLKDLGYGLIIDNTKEPGYIPKGRFDEVVGQKNQFKTQADELGRQLETLKVTAKGNEELTKQIEALQQQNADWQGKYQSTTMESAIKFAALKEKARDAGDVLAFVDKSKLQINADGTLTGLDEQLKALKESKPYLFAEEKPPGPGPLNPNVPNNSNFTKEKIEKMSADEINKNWDAIQELLKAGKI